MLIIMGGLPKSGKTSILKGVKHDIVHINPEALLSKNIDNQPEDVKQALNIAAWEQCLTSIGDNLDHNIIIFDTCGSSLNPLRTQILKAKMHGHKIVYLYVDRKFELCANHIDSKILKSYKQKFINTLPQARDAADYFRVITNNGEVQEASVQAGEVIDEILSICKSQQTSGAANRTA
ncbi:MAG: hypothetical protein GF411_13880 [Candidatus Lokiarchaeota archaeon]|nr:hypothetical protein [Candidatus Lokiarchaeota archaeon]